MGKNNIEKYSPGYSLLKAAAKFWHNYVFYRRVIVFGKENIDYKQHNIFAPNHQNALMDAMAVICTTKGQMVFLARSDIFRKKFIASILYFLKILPVYRMRDGYENLRMNDDTFLKTIDVIKNRSGLGLLPEGNHSGERRLRQLKKGICRIAFSAEEVNDFSLDLRIIPVGLEYSHYNRFRQVLTVVYGKPLHVSEFKEAYKENPAIALNKLRERLSEEIKSLMVHIEAVDDYDALNDLREIINGKQSDSIKKPKLFRDRELIEKVTKLEKTDPDLYKEIVNKASLVRKLAIENRITYRLLERRAHSPLLLLLSSLLLLSTLPLFLFGMLFNYIFIEVPKMPLKNIADKQFHSSVRYAVSLIMLLIGIPLYAIVAFIFIKPWWLAALLLASIPISGLIAWNWALLFRRTVGGFRIIRMTGAKKASFNLLQKYFNELRATVKRVVSKQ